MTSSKLKQQIEKWYTLRLYKKRANNYITLANQERYTVLTFIHYC